MSIRDIEVAAISHKVVSVVTASWTVTDLSTFSANSVTAAQAGRDIAQLEVSNTGGNTIGVKLYNETGNPAVDANVLQLDSGSSVVFPKVSGLRYVATKSLVGGSEASITVYSHQTVGTSPWS